eukprot:6413853-Prymnesium_polylepis.2
MAELATAAKAPRKQPAVVRDRRGELFTAADRLDDDAARQTHELRRRVGLGVVAAVAELTARGARAARTRHWHVSRD